MQTSQTSEVLSVNSARCNIPAEGFSQFAITRSANGLGNLQFNPYFSTLLKKDFESTKLPRFILSRISLHKWRNGL